MPEWLAKSSTLKYSTFQSSGSLLIAWERFGQVETVSALANCFQIPKSC